MSLAVPYRAFPSDGLQRYGLSIHTTSRVHKPKCLQNKAQTTSKDSCHENVRAVTRQTHTCKYPALYRRPQLRNLPRSCLVKDFIIGGLLSVVEVRYTEVPSSARLSWRRFGSSLPLPQTKPEQFCWHCFQGGHAATTRDS